MFINLKTPRRLQDATSFSLRYSYWHWRFNVRSERFSILGGAIWKLKDKLSLDFGVRQAWINNLPETEVRAGLTFAFSVQQEAYSQPLIAMVKLVPGT